MASVGRQIQKDEQVLRQSGFDFGNKVIAITNRRVLVGDKSHGVILNVRYGRLTKFRRQGRTFVIEEGSTTHKYQMGREDVVEELLQTANDFQDTEALMEYFAGALMVPISKLQSAQKAFECRDRAAGAQWLLEGH